MTVLSFLAAVLAVAFSTAMPLARENISFTAVSAPAAGDRTTVYGIPADPSGCHRIPFMGCFHPCFPIVMKAFPFSTLTSASPKRESFVYFPQMDTGLGSGAGTESSAGRFALASAFFAASARLSEYHSASHSGL